MASTAAGGDATPARRPRATRWRTCWPSRPSSNCHLPQPPPARLADPTRPARPSPLPFRTRGGATARPAASSPRAPGQMPRQAASPALRGHLRPAAFTPGPRYASLKCAPFKADLYGLFDKTKQFSEAPSAASLPKPPSHWTSTGITVHHQHKDQFQEISNQLKMLLNIKA